MGQNEGNALQPKISSYTHTHRLRADEACDKDVIEANQTEKEFSSAARRE